MVGSIVEARISGGSRRPATSARKATGRSEKETGGQAPQIQVSRPCGFGRPPASIPPRGRHPESGSDWSRRYRASRWRHSPGAPLAPSIKARRFSCGSAFHQRHSAVGSHRNSSTVLSGPRGSSAGRTIRATDAFCRCLAILSGLCSAMSVSWESPSHPTPPDYGSKPERRLTNKGRSLAIYGKKMAPSFRAATVLVDKRI